MTHRRGWRAHPGSRWHKTSVSAEPEPARLRLALLGRELLLGRWRGQRVRLLLGGRVLGLTGGVRDRAAGGVRVGARSVLIERVGGAGATGRELLVVGERVMAGRVLVRGLRATAHDRLLVGRGRVGLAAADGALARGRVIARRLISGRLVRGRLVRVVAG